MQTATDMGLNPRMYLQNYKIFTVFLPLYLHLPTIIISF